MIDCIRVLIICIYIEVLLSIDVINDNLYSVRIPSEGNLIGVIDILDEIHIEFDIIIHSFSPSGWRNILHFGNTGAEYYPAIYFDNDRQCCFYIKFSSIQNPTQHWDSSSAMTFNLNTKYNIKFTLTHNSVLFSIDNQIIVDDSTTILSHATLFNKNIYISGANYGALDCTLYGLKVTTSTSTIPYNYLCDYSNRFTIKSGSWVYDSNSCKLTQTNTTHPQAAVWMDKDDTTSVDWTDYTIITQFKINTMAASGYPDAGPLFRASSLGNYFRVYGEVGRNIVFNKLISGITYSPHTKYSPLTLGVTHKLTIAAVGCTFNIYLDDIHQFEYTDCTYSRGTVGLQTYESQVEFLSLYIIFADDQLLYTVVPSMAPSQFPTNYPSFSPTQPPTFAPTIIPSLSPTLHPTNYPSFAPTQPPTNAPSFNPSQPPTNTPSMNPTFLPSMNPSIAPSIVPSESPSNAPITPTNVQDGAIYDVTTTIENENMNNNSIANEFGFNYNVIWIGIACVLLCCVIICLFVGLMHLNRKRKMKRINLERETIKTKSTSTDIDGNSDSKEMEMVNSKVIKLTDFHIDDAMDNKIYENTLGADHGFVTSMGISHFDTIGQSSKQLVNPTEFIMPDMKLITTHTENENENDFDDMYEQDMTQTSMGNNKTPMDDNNMTTPQQTMGMI